ncbi:phage baseplate protein [Acetobacter nitrogenifigens]|nr:hypothetical protein [Acetobacter nitrogenifigens]
MTTVAQPVTANVIAGSGVPKLWSTVITSAEAVASVELDTLLQSYLVQNASSQWGLFDSSNSAVITSGRVRAIDMRVGYQVTDAPQENGAFMSYNKVKQPRQIMLEVLCDGSTMSYGDTSAIDNLVSTFTTGATGGSTIRKRFLAALEALVANTTLYTATTPEATYPNMNVVGYSIRRAADRGLYLLYADIMLQEIRLTAVSRKATAAQEPSGETQQNSGNVQTQALSDAQVAAFAQGAGLF